MPSIILTNTVASITELKTNPMATIHAAAGEPIAILNRNEPAFYCVPPRIYEYLISKVDKTELAKLIEDPQNEKSYKSYLASLADASSSK